MAEDRSELFVEDGEEDVRLEEELSNLFFTLRIRWMLLGLPLLFEMMLCKEIIVDLARKTPLGLLPALLLVAVALLVPQFMVLGWIIRRWGNSYMEQLEARNREHNADRDGATD